MPFTHTTSTAAGAWRPDVYTFAPADVVPDALILQCSTVSGDVEGDEPVLRVAYVDDDQAQFTAEGDPIPEGESVLAEVLVHTAKVTQLVWLSNEQYGQTNTAAQLSASVSRAVTRRANLAFVAEAAPVGPAVAPVAGLVNVADVVEGDDVSGSLDPLVDLIAVLQDNLAVPSHILVDPWAGPNCESSRQAVSLTQCCWVQAQPTPHPCWWSCPSSWTRACPTTAAWS
jgi:hypothetical protein